MTDPHPPHTGRAKPWATADRIGGLTWFAFGAAAFYGSWTMDRLESQNINPVTAPGLVPGLIGLGIMAFALVLLVRRGKPFIPGQQEGHLIEAGGESEASHPTNWGRLALSWALCVGFAGLLLGHGLPFWLLAVLFVFLHIMLLDEPDHLAERSLGWRIMNAVIIAVCTAALVTIVFQQIFLVRLP
jgi:hypothetical protein